MPEVMIDIPIKEVAHMISKMSKQELATLHLLLTEEGVELLKRNEDLKLNRVKYINEDEVFDV